MQATREKYSVVSRKPGNAFLRGEKMASQLKDEIKLTGQTGVEFGVGENCKLKEKT